MKDKFLETNSYRSKLSVITDPEFDEGPPLSLF